jgi:hypothetical protein
MLETSGTQSSGMMHYIKAWETLLVPFRVMTVIQAAAAD